MGEAQAAQLAHGFYCHVCAKEVDVHMDEHGEEYECCDCGGACVEAPDQSLDDFIEVAPNSSASGAGSDDLVRRLVRRVLGEAGGTDDDGDGDGDGEDVVVEPSVRDCDGREGCGGGVGEAA